MSTSSTGHGSRTGFLFRSSGEAGLGASRMPVHISHTLKPFGGFSILPPGQSSALTLFMVRLVPQPRTGPAPTVRLVPRFPVAPCTHCPTCAPAPTELAYTPGRYPHSPLTRTSNPSLPRIPLGCARAEIHDEADPALAHRTREYARKAPRLVRSEQTRAPHARTGDITLGHAGRRSHEPADADAARPSDLATLDGAVADPAGPGGGESGQGSRRMGTTRLPLAGAPPARVCDRDHEAARRAGSCGLRGAVLPTGDRPVHSLCTHVLPVPRPNRSPGYEYPTSACAHSVGTRTTLLLCTIQTGAHSGRFPSSRRGRRMRALERRDHGVRGAALHPALARMRFLSPRLLVRVAPRRQTPIEATRQDSSLGGHGPSGTRTSDRTVEVASSQLG